MRTEPAGLDAQSLRDIRAEAQDMANVAEATLRKHSTGNIPMNGRQLARYVVALSESVERLVGCVAEAERRAEVADKLFEALDGIFVEELNGRLCALPQTLDDPFSVEPPRESRCCPSCRRHWERTQEALALYRALPEGDAQPSRSELVAALADARDALERIAQSPIASDDGQKLAREVLVRLNQEPD